MEIEWDVVLRLLAAAFVGGAIGINRDLVGKPMGMRTLSLVSLGAAVSCLSVVHYSGLENHPDGLSRVLQGVIQGVLTGVGFLGAGVVLHDKRSHTVHGLTTAAAVWVTAAVGIACALGAWLLVIAATAITILILFAVPLIEGSVRPDDDANGKGGGN